MTQTAPIVKAPAPPLIPARRKLLPLSFVEVLLSIDEDKALEMAESGELWPAFNLARCIDGKRKIHVWRGAIEQRLKQTPGKTTDTFEAIVTSILPPLGMTPAASAIIRGAELAWQFCLSRAAIANLIGAGELREVGRHNPVMESPRISYNSVAEFLKRRQFPEQTQEERMSRPEN